MGDKYSLPQEEIDALPNISTAVLGDRIKCELIGYSHPYRWSEPILKELIRRGQEWERLTQENTDLRLQLFQARESLDEDHHPDGKEKWWFTPALGPHKARDTQTEREFSHGPFDCRETADIQWKLFLKERPSHDPV